MNRKPYPSDLTDTEVKGRKRHIMVDVLALLLVVVVHKTSIQGRAGAQLLFQRAVRKGFKRLAWYDEHNF